MSRYHNNNNDVSSGIKLVSMAIKPCDHCVKLSCDYCQLSLLVVIILQTEVYKWPQLERMDQYVVVMPEM